MMNFEYKHRLAGIAAALAMAGLLSACAPLLMSGAVVGSALVASDRRTTGIQLEDQSIELKAAARVRHVMGERGRVSITSYNRLVLITGEVGSDAEKAAVEQEVVKVENVRSTVNELVVLGSSAFASSLTDRSNDSFLSGKVKATFVNAKDIQAHAIKVVTERSVVYLMGRVTEQEAERASELARSISGVGKVVRVFEVVAPQSLSQ
jgi:osmotically-inducible protein OsmY